LRPPSISTLFPYTTLFRSLPISGMQGGLAAINLGVNEQQQLFLQVSDSTQFREWSDEPAYLLAENIQVLEISYREALWSEWLGEDRKSTRLNSSHVKISYA